MNFKSKFLVWALPLSLACSSSPPAYKAAVAKAHEARKHGDPREARRQYETARLAAQNEDDRAEADYRAAHIQVPGESPGVSVTRLLGVARRYPESDRAPRALLDAGRILEQEGDTEKATEVYREAVVKYPISPSSGLAFDGLLRIWVAEGIALPTLLERMSAVLEEAPELRELVLFRKAQVVEPHDAKQSLVLYEELGEAFPLPRGRYTDEALLRSAKLRLSLGDASGAEVILKALAEAHREAKLVGSYTRSAYGEAAFLRAEVHADLLGDREGAVRLFVAIPNDFPTSRLRDDAVFRAASVLSRLGRNSEACRELQTLSRIDPSSRYRRCEPVYCSGATPEGLCEPPPNPFEPKRP